MPMCHFSTTERLLLGYRKLIDCRLVNWRKRGAVTWIIVNLDGLKIRMGSRASSVQRFSSNVSTCVEWTNSGSHTVVDRETREARERRRCRQGLHKHCTLRTSSNILSTCKVHTGLQSGFFLSMGKTKNCRCMMKCLWGAMEMRRWVVRNEYGNLLRLSTL